ncbi:hypothetical protein C8R47DRAFT_1218075 [Mycena vitilis]|nr:hypothetical protein C8R47DRAFT_1218075 [Mycena vitilis]
MSSQEPRWPAKLDSLNDVLDFLGKTGTPSLAQSEFELDYYPPPKSLFVERSAYSDVDGAPYRFFVFGRAKSGVVYGDSGPHFLIEDGGTTDARSGHNFRSQLKALTLPVKVDEDEDYDENKNANMIITPCTDCSHYDMSGGTWIDLRIGNSCVLWSEHSGSEGRLPTIPRPPTQFPVTTGSWVLGYGTLHKRESVHWETRTYELMVWDLRVLDLARNERTVSLSKGTLSVEDTTNVQTHADEAPSPPVSTVDTISDRVVPTAAASPPSAPTDNVKCDSVDIPDLAATSDSTLSDTSTSDRLEVAHESGKRRASSPPAAPQRKSKRTKKSAT